MNCLQLIRELCGRTGISRPNSVASSGDTQVIQLLGLLNEEGQELSGRYEWESLTREATFVTVAAEDQGALTTIIGATNVYRHIVNETIWNRTTQEALLGPKAPRTWQGLKALGVTGPYSEYRIRGGHLLFLPAPSAGDTCAFEYLTKNWATDSAATVQKSLVTADEDIFLLDEQLLLLGTRWRWLREKGLSYDEIFRAYESKVVDAMAKDGTKSTKNLDSGGFFSGVQEAIPRLIGS